MSLLSFLQHSQLYVRPWLRFIISFRPICEFFLSFCWLTGSGGFGPHGNVSREQGVGVGVGVGKWILDRT